MYDEDVYIYILCICVLTVHMTSAVVCIRTVGKRRQPGYFLLFFMQTKKKKFAREILTSSALDSVSCLSHVQLYRQCV